MIRFCRATKANPTPSSSRNCFDFPQDGGFQILFAVGVFQPEEIEEYGSRENTRSGESGSVGPGLAILVPGEFCGLLRKRRALEQHAADLATQGADAPPLDAAHLGVKVPFQFFFEVDNFQKV